MKTKYKIDSLFRDDLGDELFNQLCAIYPEGCADGQSFYSALAREDPRVEVLLDTLRSHGYEPGSFQPSGHDKTFMMEVLRTYDVKDYQEAAYLVPYPEVTFHGERGEDGLITLDEVEPNEQIAAVLPSATVVSASLKEEMERSGLLHLVFREVLITEEAGKSLSEPFWELTTDLTLPAVSPSMYWANSNGKPFNGDPSKGKLLREAATGPESLIVMAELHYQAEDLQAVEPFDMARMRERSLEIVSQRFYQICAARQLNMWWMPVRIDP